MSIVEIEKYVSILGDSGQFLFGLLAVTLSIYALSVKRKDIFKSELAKSQFREMGVIRTQLSEIFFDIHFVRGFKSSIEFSGSNLKKFELENPEQWEQYQRYKENSLSLYYKIMTPDYYLIPQWMDSNLIKKHYETMRNFAPFTVHSTGNKSSEEIEGYQNEIIALINHIDFSLRKNA